MPKGIHHVVKRPGRKHGDPDVEIPVAEELATVPGIPIKEGDVSFYSREYPLETQEIDKAADREWMWTVFTPDIYQYLKQHYEATEPLKKAAATTGDLEPTQTGNGEQDLTEVIRAKAREMGFGEVGFTKYDRRYTYASKKQWVKFEHAVCVALEQDYAETQQIPSLEAEHAH